MESFCCYILVCGFLSYLDPDVFHLFQNSYVCFMFLPLDTGVWSLLQSFTILLLDLLSCFEVPQYFNFFCFSWCFWGGWMVYFGNTFPPLDSLTFECLVCHPNPRPLRHLLLLSYYYYYADVISKQLINYCYPGLRCHWHYWTVSVTLPSTGAKAWWVARNKKWTSLVFCAY